MVSSEDHKVVVCPLCGRCETCDHHAGGCRIGQLEAENAELRSSAEKAEAMLRQVWLEDEPICVGYERWFIDLARRTGGET